MYNGIGLTTPRGSGTNGYVVRNLSAIPHRRAPVKQLHELEEEQQDRLRERKPNEEILLHERKRQVELECMNLRLSLEEKNDLTEEQIEESVDALRKRLRAELDEVQLKSAKLLKEHQVHERQQAKSEENIRIKAALGIASDYVEGQAFDRE
ncbi:hypothetical protein SYNPS1DRAFT_8675, partial [Syncephalis pseudoplumigaleata]